MANNLFQSMEDQAQPQSAPIARNDNAAPSDNMFQDMEDSTFGPSETSPLSSAMHGAELSGIPAAAGIATAGAGAEIGAALGAPFGGVGAIPGAAIGGIAGGILGSVAGSYAGSTAQDWALSAMPENWKDALGVSDRQIALDQKYQNGWSFLGGLVPYAVTMSPGGFARSALPENATALQRILAHPVTSHLFSGTLMGGMELGQEAASGQPIDWRHVAIATGVGTIFNRPNRIGETIAGAGAPAAETPALAGSPENPTLAQAGDLKVMGPGVTEQVFDGSHQQNPAAEMVAQQQARVEQGVLNPDAGKPDPLALARKSNPELFASRDALQQQYDDLSARLRQLQSPTDEDIAGLTDQRDALQSQLDAHIAGQNGYAGGATARQLRAQIRDAQGQIDDMATRREAFAAGEGADTPEMSAIRQQMLATTHQLWDLGPQIAAATRRAADYLGSDIVEPPEPQQPPIGMPPAAEEPSAAEEHPGGPVAAQTEQEAVAIAANVARQMMVAGRPAPEAEAVGQLYAQRYVTRAQNFNGVMGSPLDLYNLEGPQISGVEPTVPKVPKAGRKTRATAPVAPEDAVAAADTIGATNLIKRLIGKGASDDEISGVLGGKLNAQQVAGVRESIGAPATEVLAQTAPEVPAGEMDRKALAEYLRSGGTVSAPGKELLQGKQGSIRIREGVAPTIKLFRGNADPSTIIHESGHAWLEEMIRDANHPSAGDQIKADMAATRKWLGMADDQPRPTTPQHEKFADGFIQYLREGVAPSRTLASVFSQFKSWLTQIYKTVTGLGSPIDDDIRGVFDRLLSTAPERTVIAEHPGRVPSIADLHEADAESVLPRDAEPAMDRVIAEKQHYVASQPPKVQDELVETAGPGTADAADAGAENSAGTGGGGEVVAPGGQPEPQPAGGNGSGEHGALVPSGAPAGQQGAGVAGGTTPGGTASGAGLRDNGPEPAGGAGSDASGGIAPGPADTFAGQSSKFTDKAGNIRLDNLNTTADVAQAIRESARENQDFIGERRGIITDGQVHSLADAMGMDAAMLNRRKLGEAFNAEQIVAARKLLIQSAQSLSDIAKRVAGGDDASIEAYAAAKARHNLIQGHVSGITAEAGRALRAFRRLPGTETVQGVRDVLAQSDARTLFQLKAEASMMAGLDNSGAVSKFARDSSTPGFWDGVLEYWRNALISNPATHATYAVGNEAMSLLKAVPETAVAAMIGRVRERMGRAGERVYAPEVKAQIEAHMRSLPAALHAAGQSLKAGQTTLLPGEKPHQLPFQSQAAGGPVYSEDYAASQILPDLWGSLRGILDGSLVSGHLAKIAEGVEGAPGISFQPSLNGVIPNIAINGVTAIPVGEAVRLPSRAVGALHSFFRATNYSMEINRLAFRDGLARGLAGPELDAHVANLRQNPTPEMMDAARTSATEMTLMSQGGEFTQALSRFINSARVGGIPILKFVDPFVRIASNVIDQSIIQRTPVGLLSHEVRADLSGVNGNVAADTAAAKMLVGSALALGVGFLAAKGVVSGSGPTDPAQAAIWRMAGNQAHSVRIGDTWYSVGHLGSLGMLMGVAADMYDVAHLASEGDLMAAGSALGHAFTQNILDESFMRGPADLINAVDDPGRYGQSYIRNFASSFLPYSSALAQMDRMSDPYSRQARSVMDGIRAKVPGMSEYLMPRRDIWGEPMPNGTALGGLTSIYTSQVSRDPVNLALANIGMGVGQPSRSIRNVRLGDDQYDYYSMIAGRMAHQRLETIVGAPDWQTWAPEMQRNVIQEVISQSRETARNAVMARWPSIPQQALQSRMRRFSSSP